MVNIGLNINSISFAWISCSPDCLVSEMRSFSRNTQRLPRNDGSKLSYGLPTTKLMWNSLNSANFCAAVLRSVGKNDRKLLISKNIIQGKVLLMIRRCVHINNRLILPDLAAEQLKLVDFVLSI